METLLLAGFGLAFVIGLVAGFFAFALTAFGEFLVIFFGLAFTDFPRLAERARFGTVFEEDLEDLVEVFPAIYAILVVW